MRIKNPETGKMVEIDDYHYFDVFGKFPSMAKKKVRKKKRTNF